MDFEFNVCAEDGETIWENRARSLSSLGVGKNHKRGYIRFAMDPEMLILLLEPNLWDHFRRPLCTTSAHLQHMLFSAVLSLYQHANEADGCLAYKDMDRASGWADRYAKTVDGKVINYGGSNGAS